jgi:membrane carboxypeptidase/penicillin-binding protein
VTIAVWVGYDNGDGKRRSLGGGATGAGVALPIFEPILQTIWAEGVAPKAVLAGPSAEAKLHLVDLPIDYYGGELTSDRQGFIEHFRLGADGKMHDTQNQIIARNSPDGHQVKAKKRRRNDENDQAAARNYSDGQMNGWGWWDQGRNFSQDSYNQNYSQQVRRRDPAYFWRERPF